MKGSLILKILLPVATVAILVYFVVGNSRLDAVVAEAKLGVAVGSVPGTVLVKAEKQMEIKSEHPGRIADSKLVPGKVFSQGELLVLLDTRDVDLQIERAEAELETTRQDIQIGSSSRYSLASAEVALEDTRRRFERGTASSKDLLGAERAVEQVQELIAREELSNQLKIEQLENNLKVLRRKRQAMSIVAPTDGLINEIHAYEGALLSGGQAIAEIVSTSRIVEVKISEENFAGIEIGQSARVVFLGYRNETFDGEVSRIIPVADEASQRYTVHLTVDIDASLLSPGLTGETSITKDERANAVIVPSRALIGNSVLKVVDGVVEITRVKRGYDSLTSTEILEGLSAGDLVIVEDLQLFRDGDRVNALPQE